VPALGELRVPLRQAPTSAFGRGATAWLAIVPALVREPSVSVADEPTHNVVDVVDVACSGEIIELFNDQRREQGVGVVLVVHDKEIARRAEVRMKLPTGRS